MAATANSLRTLQTHGQSVWVDARAQAPANTAELRALIDQEGISGILFPPLPPAAQTTSGAGSAQNQNCFSSLAEAADLLGDLHRNSRASEGFVCVSPAPHDSNDSRSVVHAARHLWQTLERPNLMINIAATHAGITALQELIRDGVNVSVTVTGDIDRYWDIADAYYTGLEARLAAGLPINHIASVIHLPLAPIDERIDPILARIARHTRLGATQLAGKAAVACAKRLYQDYRQSTARHRFQLLSHHHAQPQRPLWAATQHAAGQPRSEDMRYIQPLIGPHTVSAMSLPTIAAFHELSLPLAMQATLSQGMAEAGWVLTGLRGLGIDF